MSGVKVLNLELDGTYREPVYGGFTMGAHYTMQTEQNGIKNSYKIACEIRGLGNGSPYMDVTSVEALDNNEETLTEEGVTDVFDNHVS